MDIMNIKGLLFPTQHKTSPTPILNTAFLPISGLNLQSFATSTLLPLSVAVSVPLSE
jgi:hypothetical protein